MKKVWAVLIAIIFVLAALSSAHASLPGDFSPADNDVDGSDLAALIANVGLLDITTFAQNFGQSLSATALHEINTRLNEYAGVLRSRGVNLTEADVADFYVDAASFGLMDGYNKSDFIMLNEAQLLKGTTSLVLTGMSYPVPVPGQCDIANGNCRITTKWIFDDGTISRKDFYQMARDNGIWKITGNNLKSYVEKLYPAAVKGYLADGTIRIESGIRMEFWELHDYNFEYATVTGPGLPSAGVMLTRWVPFGVFTLDAASRASNQYSGHIYYKDLDIDAIPDDGSAEYEIRFYSDATRTNLMEIRQASISRRPLKVTEITDDYFGTFSHPATHSLATFPAGGSYAFTYSKPTALEASSVQYRVYFSGNNTRNAFYQSGRLDAGSDAVAFTKNPSSTQGDVSVWFHDVYDRYAISTWELK